MRAHEDDSRLILLIYFFVVFLIVMARFMWIIHICGKFVRNFRVSKPVRSRACRWYINCTTLHAMYDLL